MKTVKITVKLRNAVPVCLVVEGKEVKRYRNIELPNELKEIGMKDFHFNVPTDGKITFEIHYEPGTLPQVFPEPRASVKRKVKATSKITAPIEEMNIPAKGAATLSTIEEAVKEPVTVAPKS